jgi:hypothetical protein
VTKKSVTKISDKVVKVSESFTVNMYDNGYMFEVSGRDNDGDYKGVKILAPTVEQLVLLIKEAIEMERDE